MTTTAEPEVYRQTPHDALQDATTDFNVCSGPARAHIRQADSYWRDDNEVDWWDPESAGPHFLALIEAATTLAKEAEDLEKTVRNVMSDLDAQEGRSEPC